MSKITIALEAAVATVKANTPEEGTTQTARQRVTVDKAFARILTLIAPRIRHFIRQYGLAAHWDDAEQVCSIAVHRAIQAYEPEKAQFTTFVNWQIRGELQSLRFRLMTDQRPSAKKVEATTVSLDAISQSDDGEDVSIIASIVDEEALGMTESAASDYLARGATASLIDSYIEHLRRVAMDQMRRRTRSRKTVAAEPGEARAVWRSRTSGLDAAELEQLEQRLQRNREVVERRLFDIATLDTLEDDTGVTKERVRQIAKRAAKTMAELAEKDPRFAMMAEYKGVAASTPTVH
jgi:RNA polymerase sigma-32 factor